MPLAVLLVVGLTRAVVERTLHLRRYAEQQGLWELEGAFPATTCPVQSTFLTGSEPSQHGIVANGWFDRELSEVHFWKQSNHLVRGPKLWDLARQRRPGLSVANLFWWFNMYSSVDYSVTPRPIYKADGRKESDLYTQPPELRYQLPPFPLHRFWGPGAGLPSSRWIADCARFVFERHRPDLNLVYLPHLDYSHQRNGPDHPLAWKAVQEVDELVGELLEFYARRETRVVILSEYGIEPVHRAVPLNLHFRQQGWLRVREEEGLELLDAGASQVFAVVDHQVAHIYAQPRQREAVVSLLKALPGVGQVLPGFHPRAGELVAVAAPGHWFCYRYWEEDRRAPDFARTVDIHRKPGFDPLELHFDPRLALLPLRLLAKMLARRLGFRTLFDFIPLDEGLVRGSHGRGEPRPVLLGPITAPSTSSLEATRVCSLLLELL